MEDFAMQTKDFDDKLNLEMSRLELLKDSMSRSNQMTESMVTVLSSFENRLVKLEETINPVYMETGNLQRRHENIEKTLNQLDHVVGFFHITEEVEPIIRDGPSSDLDQYLICMDKLHKAVKFFDDNNPDSAEMSHATMLFEAGKDSLEREFRNLLTRHSRPVAAVTILDMLAAEEELVNEEGYSVETALPPRVRGELTQIGQWLNMLVTGNKYTSDYMQIYSKHRSDVICKSLQNLRDHMKTGSKDSTNMTMSPAMNTKQSSSTRKNQKRIAFVRKASTSLMKNSIAQHLEAAGLRRTPSSAADMTSLEKHDLDIDSFINALSALLKLIQVETSLMQDIIPMKHERSVFDRLIIQALESVIKEGEQIAVRVRAATSRHDHSAVMGVFPVLKHIRTIKPEYDSALEGCQAPTRSKLSALISTLDATGSKALNEFVDSIRNDPDKSSNMPRDGTVHELTSNTIIFLEQLLEFADTVGSMFLTQDPNTMTTKKDPEMERKRKVAEYMTRVLGALDLNLNNKCETYGESVIKSIFMLNNGNYILKSLSRSGLLKVVVVASPDIALIYEDKVREQKRLYSQSWSRCLHYVMDTQRPIGHGDKLKDKERQAIKDKFTGFNKEMDDIWRTQRSYAIPDSELADALKNDNQEYIVPKYRIFLEKYSKLNFTKNTEKYIKFSVEDVSRCIDQFFDSAA